MADVRYTEKWKEVDDDCWWERGPPIAEMLMAINTLLYFYFSRANHQWTISENPLQQTYYCSRDCHLLFECIETCCFSPSFPSSILIGSGGGNTKRNFYFSSFYSKKQTRLHRKELGLGNFCCFAKREKASIARSFQLKVRFTILLFFLNFYYYKIRIFQVLRNNEHNRV